MTSTASPSRTLFLPPRPTAAGRALAHAAERRGLGCEVLPGRWVPDAVRGAAGPALFAGPGFADVVAVQLGLGLLEAPVDWLAGLPRELTGRHVACVPLAAARALRRPAFVKPPNDKSFPARIYPDGSRLPGPDALDDTTPVLVSDVVAFSAEYRLFLLDGEVRTGSRYGVRGGRDLLPLDADPCGARVREFAARVVAAGPRLPSAIVVDVGRLVDGGWAVIEANAAWASGHYAADPDAALEVLLRAARPRESVTAADEPFLRPR
ncbi:ATP-grasp domain-containing protein [Streptomyces sp. NPDC058171]